MFRVRAMIPENLNTYCPTAGSRHLVFWLLWEDCCQYHSPATTKAAISQESNKEEGKGSSYCLFNWHESKVSCMERGQRAPLKKHGRQRERERRHAGSSAPEPAPAEGHTCCHTQTWNQGPSPACHTY